MNKVVTIICCVVIMLVLARPNTQVKGHKHSCANLKVRLAPCLLHLKHCHRVCKSPPCDACGALPSLCCLNLDMIARKMNSDEDAKMMCSCIKEKAIEKDRLPGFEVSRLPKACLINIKIPVINANTDCSRYVQLDISSLSLLLN
ncbi:putative bifunctional inhibitor/plant lipid transfer protein/seed storage helical domain superfamily [Helianthus annuus]|nr:putative bifunctional inhibitor/plant lipid transfer protein/seed storage helical domain superfamily [Helianthus annuus]